MRDDSVVLYCVKCAAGYGSLGEIPPRCPACGRETRWTTTPPRADTPKIPYTLNASDKKLLKDRGIES